MMNVDPSIYSKQTLLNTFNLFCNKLNIDKRAEYRNMIECIGLPWNKNYNETTITKEQLVDLIGYCCVDIGFGGDAQNTSQFVQLL